jgi:hypothetical protein
MESIIEGEKDKKDEKPISGADPDDADIVPEAVKRRVSRWQLEEETRTPVDHEKSAHKVGGRRGDVAGHASDQAYRPGYRHGRLDHGIGGRHRR